MNSIFKKRKCLSEREVVQYLQGKLSDDERYELENHLLDCPLCAAAVESFANSQNPADDEADIQAIRRAVSRRSRGPRLRATTLIKRVAAVALLLLLAFAGYRYWQATTPQRLFARYFSPVENNYLSLRNGGEEPLPIGPELQQALEYYNLAEFTSSIPHFENYLAQEPGDLQARLLAASACLEAWQAEKAEAHLRTLRQQDSPYDGQASWYLALALLQQDKTEAARQQLQLIAVDGRSAYREAAKKLLRAL